MSMLRQDPLTGRWVIIAAHRSERPNEFSVVPRTRTAQQCPFCPGNEEQTTPEVLALGRRPGAAANGPGWRLRAFNNMYPALVPVAASVPVGAAEDLHPTLFPGAQGLGRHEVVVYTPDHFGSPANLTVGEMAELLTVLRSRARDFAGHPAVRYVSAFCNHGPDAGATLAHPHMQIIGAPQVPLLAAVKAARCASYLADQGSCLMCALIAAECEAETRLVASNDDWVAWTPWASRFPWEMMFAPRRHSASLNQASEAELASLAAILLPALRALWVLHGELSLNVVIHSTAVDGPGLEQDPDSYHWHLEVLPRLNRPAGFEVGTGYTINAVVPEVAASRLRQESMNP